MYPLDSLLHVNQLVHLNVNELCYRSGQHNGIKHDDVTTWKRFPHDHLDFDFCFCCTGNCFLTTSGGTGLKKNRQNDGFSLSVLWQIIVLCLVLWQIIVLCLVLWQIIVLCLVLWQIIVLCLVLWQIIVLCLVLWQIIVLCLVLWQIIIRLNDGLVHIRRWN